MPFDAPPRPLRLFSPRDTLEAKFAEIDAAFAKASGGLKPPVPTSYEGLGDSVRLANEYRLRWSD